MVEPHAPAREADEPLGMTWSAGRVLAVLAILGMALFWLWIWSGAPAKRNPDWLADRNYAAALEDRCQALRGDIDALPKPDATPRAGERAVVIDQANDLVDAFITDIEGDAPTTGDAAKSMKGWITDWKSYLADRRDFVDRLEVDPSARLYVDESVLGDSVDKTIEIFAEVNEIPDCATPGDVG